MQHFRGLDGKDMKIAASLINELDRKRKMTVQALEIGLLTPEGAWRAASIPSSVGQCRAALTAASTPMIPTAARSCRLARALAGGSAVEHSLGKGEVVSSILTGSTRKAVQI